MIQLAAPLYLAWALLALPIIALFILRVRLRRLPVSTLLFWDQLMQDRRPRAWWQRLRNLLSLLLQLALLALIVAALVDPLWSWQAAQPRRVALVVDNSASMNARAAPGAASRLEEATRAGESMVRSLRDRDRMAIITAGGQPRVQLGMTDDVRRLQTAVRAVSRTDAPDQLAPALALARQLVSGTPGGEVIVLTDKKVAAADPQADPSIKVYGVGERSDNVAITAFQTRRSVADALGYQILLEVTNFGQAAAQRQLEIDLEEAPIDVVPLRLDPGETWRQTLDHTSAAGGRLTARLLGADALPGDDLAIAVLPRRDPVTIVLVTPGSLFLQNVLQAIPGVELSLVSELPPQLPPGAILVLHRTLPDSLPPGPVLVIDPRTSSDHWQLGDAIATPLVTEQTKDAPLLAHIRLQNVLLPGARALRFVGPVEPLLESPLDEPLYARLPRRGGDLLVLTAELDQGDLPLRIAFPVMMKNAVEWFLGNKGELQPALAAGQSTIIRAASFSTDTSPAKPTTAGAAPVRSVAATAADSSTANIRTAKDSVTADDVLIEDTASVETAAAPWVLRSPDGELLPLSAPTRAISVGPLYETGLWLAGPREILQQDPAPDPLDERLVPLAVNLTSVSESDLRDQHELPPPPGAALAEIGGYSLWVYLVIVAVIGAVIEWVLYQRRMVA